MKTRLRKRSKSKVTIDRADRALQDHYRRQFAKTGQSCECGCGRLAEVCHHHIEKSKSNFLRFARINLVFLSHFCHSKITFQDHSVVARYSIRKGDKWVKKMDELKIIKKQHYTKKELGEIIKNYE
jgi:hypothetical protein